MKNGAEHKVLLAPEVIDLLRRLPRDGDGYLFVGARAGAPLSAKALHRLLGRMGEPVTVHGFRSSFSDWAHESTAHANHAIEISLAHRVGNDAEQAYRRGPMIAKRARLMADWARFCCTPPKAVSDNVVAIGAR
jgi:integrase